MSKSKGPARSARRERENRGRKETETSKITKKLPFPWDFLPLKATPYVPSHKPK
jgi:hypothetical protein